MAESAAPVIEIDAAASPFGLPETWDRIVIAGQTWPPQSSGYTSTKIKISGAKRAYKWDVKDGLGLQGALETYRGQTPPAFTVTFWIWDSALYTAWLSFQPLMQYNGVKTQPKPISIYHPLLANLGIYQVIVEDISGVEMVDEPARLFAVTVTMREFFQPLPVPATTPDATSNGDPALPQEDPAIVRAQQELGVAIGQLNATGLLGTNPQSIQPPPPPFK